VGLGNIRHGGRGLAGPLGRALPVAVVALVVVAVVGAGF
jgi:hypothetical protein